MTQEPIGRLGFLTLSGGSADSDQHWPSVEPRRELTGREAGGPCGGEVLNRRRVVGRGRTKTQQHALMAMAVGDGSHDGEFDPGSGSTLAACLKHASRTAPFGAQWRTAE